MALVSLTDLRSVFVFSFEFSYVSIFFNKLNKEISLSSRSLLASRNSFSVYRGIFVLVLGVICTLLNAVE